MPALWSGSLGELKTLAAADLPRVFEAACRRRLLAKPSPAQLRAWSSSLPAICNHLEDRRFDDIQAIVEMQMPVGAERADLVLLGSDPGNPRGYIIETKQWSSAALDPEACEVEVEGFGLHQHPIAQVVNYQGKLSMFNERASRYEFAAGAYLHNLGPQGMAQLLQECNDALPRHVQLFGRNEGEALAYSVASHLLPTSLDAFEHEAVANSPYRQGDLLFDVLAKHSDSISKRAIGTLAEAGFSLFEDQELLVEAALKSARNAEKEIFIVRGGPGSGKTLVAVHLLLRALAERMRCILAIRNNRLQAILRKCFDVAFPGASGVLMYFEVPGHGTGIGDAAFEGTFDLVICDEAQRMREASMDVVLQRAPTCVAFLDEGQRLNPREQGTVRNFSAAAGRSGRKVEARELKGAVRCRGGDLYHDFVERILADPSVIGSAGGEPWRDNYEFRICSSVDELLGSLVARRRENPSARVALVASFTESPGSIGRVGDPENVRVGFPLTSGWDRYKGSGLEIRWLMKPSEYVSYWMRGRSNDLKTTASIYGAQGFEADYVGVIWGRDLVVRDGKWALGDPAHCYDTVDGLVSRRKGGPARWHAEALDLVLNRYRIFLTRGLHGTSVYFEDGAPGHAPEPASSSGR